MNGQTAKTKKIFDGRYEILSIVGRGARSVVYHARHVSSPHSEVALKVLIDQKGKNPSSERLRREALAMVSCRHRYVARLDDFHSVGSLCYLSMEYAPESDLRNFIKKQNNRLPLELAERFLKQCSEGLAFIHRAGIIHRDLKPENLLVMNEKEIRITDFGVALLPGEECSIADLQSGVGTMNYMAPEILEGRQADQRSDIYALGVIFYEMISGKNPFAGAPLAKQIDIRKSESFKTLNDLNSSIPKYLSDLISQCMHYEPEERFANSDQLLANLISKKSDNFEKSQKSRPKPARPKTNNIHKRPRKSLTKTKEQESEDLFAEFDRLISEDTGTTDKQTSSADSTQEIDLSENLETSENNSKSESKVENLESTLKEEENTSHTSTSDKALTDEDLSHNPFESTGNESKSEIGLEGSAADNLAEQISTESEFESNLDDDLEHDESNYYKSSAQANIKSQSSLKRYFIIAASVLIFAMLILPQIRKSFFSSVSSGISSLAFWHSAEIELPTFESTEITFPNLPKGVYSGSIKGILPGKTSPLTMISFGESGKIAILIGIDGWSPVIIDQLSLKGKDSKGQTLKIASNGIVLELKADATDKKLAGQFINIINGSKGEWSAEPAV